MSLRARVLSGLLAVLTALCGCASYYPVARPSGSLSHEIEVHFTSPREVTARLREGTVHRVPSVRRLSGRPIALWMDTLVVSTAWFQTDSGWRAFSDPAVVRVPIAEPGVRLSERRVSPGRTLLAIGAAVPVAWILFMVLYAATYSAAT
jgi:hypothetical protein